MKSIFQICGRVKIATMRFTILLIAILSPAMTPLIAAEQNETYSARVIQVRDGDSLIVSHNRKLVALRFQGIDCPEQGQAHGALAKKLVEDLALSKMVVVRTYGKDRYGRTLAEVQLPNKRCLNQELLRAGFCTRARGRSAKTKSYCSS